METKTRSQYQDLDCMVNNCEGIKTKIYGSFNEKYMENHSRATIICSMAGCSDDDDTTSSFFELSSTDLECNSNNVIDVVVPIEGQTYKLTVKSSVDVIWTTKLEGGSWIVATPVTKQSGDGEILIVASSNPTNIKNREDTVTIRNSVNDEIYRYAFTQSYDPNQMAQKEELYAYIHYNEDRYNKEELIYTTSINKVEGNVSISSLGQEELDKYMRIISLCINFSLLIAILCQIR